MGKAGESTGVLGRKSRKTLAENMHADETVLFCLAGANDQAIVALDQRLLVIKTGMVAGLTFGARATSLNYGDIRGIEIRRGVFKSYIELTSAGFEDRANKDPYKEPNCLPCFSSDLPKYKPYLDRLNATVSAAKISGNGRVASADISGELQKLAELRRLGALSEEEFSRAKAKLLA